MCVSECLAQEVESPRGLGRDLEQIELLTVFGQPVAGQSEGLERRAAVEVGTGPANRDVDDLVVPAGAMRVMGEAGEVVRGNASERLEAAFVQSPPFTTKQLVQHAVGNQRVTEPQPVVAGFDDDASL